MRFNWPLAFIYLIATTISVLILFPVGNILLDIFISNGTIDLAGVSRASALPGIGETILNTGIVVASGVIIALFLGTGFAWLNERTDARLGWIAGILPIVPLLAPPITIAIGWVFMLSPRAGFINVAVRWLFGIDGTSGPFNIFSWYGLIALYALELTPMVYLVVAAALRDMDPMLEQASRVYGFGPFKTFVRITIPSVRGALASAAWLATSVGLALFSAPSIIGRSAGIDVLTSRIVRLLTAQYPPKVDVAVVLGGLILAVIGVGWLIQRRVLKGGRFSMIGGKATSETRVRLGAWRLPCRILMAGFVFVSVVIPVGGLLLVSLQPFWSANFNLLNISLSAYETALSGSGPTALALWNSVKLGAACATVIIFVSFCVSILDLWLKPSRMSSVFDGILKVPAGFSQVIVAIGIVLVFFGAPFNLSGTLLIIGIAYIVIYMPQGSISVGSTLSQVDLQLLEASQMSGAGFWRTVSKILMPLSLGGIANGWVLIFVYVIGDLTASVLLSGTATPTVGYVLLQEFNNGSYPVIAAFGVLISMTSSLVVLTVLWLTSQRRRRD